MDPNTPNKRLTVAHIMPWEGVGGVEIATIRLIETTRDRFNHVAFCLKDAHAVRERFESSGIKTVSYELPEPSVRHWRRFRKQSRTLAELIRRVGANIVHFAEVKAAYHAGRAAVLAQTHLLCHVRVSIPKLDWRHKLFLRPVQSYVFVSKEAMDTFAIALPKNRACVVYDAIDIPSDIPGDIAAIREEFGIPSGAPVVGTVARVSAQKDYFTLAAAAVRVLKQIPDARFLIVGDNSLVALNRQHYEEVAKKLDELGIRENFIFTGHREDVPRLIAAMDFCVLSTHREGFPLSILESMALQKPVVATSVGGIPEIVIPDVNGYLHDHEDSTGLASSIISLIENPAHCEQLGKEAKEYVRKNYSKKKFDDEISAAYYNVMDQTIKRKRP
jgi:glycosyltransferase involved in cell wall biosynthesis